jgi:hypothetical protein
MPLVYGCVVEMLLMILNCVFSAKLFILTFDIFEILTTMYDHITRCMFICLHFAVDYLKIIHSSSC